MWLLQLLFVFWCVVPDTMKMKISWLVIIKIKQIITGQTKSIKIAVFSLICLHVPHLLDREAEDQFFLLHTQKNQVTLSVVFGKRIVWRCRLAAFAKKINSYSVIPFSVIVCSNFNWIFFLTWNYFLLLRNQLVVGYWFTQSLSVFFQTSDQKTFFSTSISWRT